MDTARLDDFSKAFAENLFVRHPDLAKYAQAQCDGRAVGFLRVTAPAPPEAAADHGLTITTENSEVTVGFDYYHQHFSQQVGDGNRFGPDYALQFISHLLAEEIAVVSWWVKGELSAFSTIEGGQTLMGSDLVGPYDRKRVRSWHGKRNRDENA